MRQRSKSYLWLKIMFMAACMLLLATAPAVCGAGCDTEDSSTVCNCLGQTPAALLAGAAIIIEAIPCGAVAYESFVFSTCRPTDIFRPPIR